MTKNKNKTSKQSPGRHTKDKVLQARIPEDLDTELRNRSEQLGLSVSSIVRNVLSNTLDLVEDIVTDSARVSRVLRTGQASQDPADEKADEISRPTGESQAIAWQEMVLNVDAACDECGAMLSRGDRAAVGIPVVTPADFLCPDCLGNLSNETEQLDPEN